VSPVGAQSESKAVPRVSEFYLHDKGSEARVFQDGKIIIYTKKKNYLKTIFSTSSPISQMYAEFRKIMRENRQSR